MKYLARAALALSLGGVAGTAAHSLAAPAPAASYLPLVVGMAAAGTGSMMPLPPQESLLVSAVLRAHGVDLAALSPAERRIVLARVPSYPPVIGPITSGFGARVSPFGQKREFHRGVDIAARRGVGIGAASDGVVIRAGWLPGLGKSVAVDHGGGLVTQYGHMSKLLVRRGDQVRRGALLGRVGSTGRSTGSHLHYEVRLNGDAVDPAQFFVLRPYGEGTSSLFALGGSMSSTARLVASVPAPAAPFFWRW